MKLNGAALLLLTSMASSLASAQETPVIVNSQTGASVELTRAYWDPNNDIANRVMQCDFYVFIEESQVYEERPDFVTHRPLFPWFRSSPYYHLPLPRYPVPVNSAFIGTEPADRVSAYLPLWSVTDGAYRGIAPIMASEFVEIVAHGSDTLNAVRVWHSTAQYHVCYDPEGTPMVPTGQPDVSPQLAEPIDDLIVTFDGLGDHTEETPVLIDRETGTTIEFSTGRWNYNRDIAARRFDCASHRWIDSEGEYQFETYPDNANSHWYHPYNGGDSILVSYMGSDGDLGSTYSYSIAEDIAHWFRPQGRRFLELTNGAFGSSFRHWGETNEGFRSCSVNLIGVGATPGDFGPSLPLEINDEQTSDNDEASTAVNECDYTNAADYDGWGWNTVTMSSCPPQTDDNPVDETTGVNDGIDVTDDTQTNPNSSIASPNDSSGNTNNTVNTTTDEGGANETTSEPPGVTTSESSDGGGSVWLPLLFIVLASRRLALLIQPQNQW